MGYSVNQINNLLRTYPQHLKVRPTRSSMRASVGVSVTIWTAVISPAH